MAEQQREKLETPARFILFFAYLSLLRYAMRAHARSWQRTICFPSSLSYLFFSSLTLRAYRHNFSTISTAFKKKKNCVVSGACAFMVINIHLQDFIPQITIACNPTMIIFSTQRCSSSTSNSSGQLCFQLKISSISEFQNFI